MVFQVCDLNVTHRIYNFSPGLTTLPNKNSRMFTLRWCKSPAKCRKIIINEAKTIGTLPCLARSLKYIFAALFSPDHKMAALGGGRSTLANQGVSCVVEATPLRGHDTIERTRRERTETVEAGYWLDILLRVAPRVKLYNSSPFAS